jgi:ribosomal protein S18 acetylase RimI-like enzyme
MVAYPASETGEFETTLLHAHDDSLDCPELHGIRSPAEVLAGYRDCAPDTSRWYLARVGDAPVGVLILGPGELHFVGVLPEWRGQGVGRALVEEALARDPQLSLIVDARNIPAIRLYRSVGFEVAGSRDVFLRFR